MTDGQRGQRIAVKVVIVGATPVSRRVCRSVRNNVSQKLNGNRTHSGKYAFTCGLGAPDGNFPAGLGNCARNGRTRAWPEARESAMVLFLSGE